MRMTNKIYSSAKAQMESCPDSSPRRHARYVLNISLLLRSMVLCGALLSASQLFATSINPLATPCAITTTLDVLVADGSVGCTLGGVFDANSFTFSASAGAPLLASDITVTPSVITLGGVIVSIDFNFSGRFSNPNASGLEYAVGYTLDPPSPVILGASVTLDPSGTLTENICAGGAFSGSSCLPGSAFQSVLVATGPLPNASTAFPSAVTTVDYQLKLDLAPGDSANGFDSASVTGLAAGTPTPEPSSIFLLASGLLGLRSFRKRQPSS
jgi:hypothetical protein